MGNILAKRSIEFQLRKFRTSGLHSKKPFGESLSEGVPEEVTLMLLFLYKWGPKRARLTPPYLKQLVEAEDIKLYLFTGRNFKRYLFRQEGEKLIAKHHDPSPVFITVLAYLSSLPEPLLLPEHDWHSLGHSIVEDSVGYHPGQMKTAQTMLKNMPETHRKLLAMVLLVVRQACEDDTEFVIEKDLYKLCNVLAPALCGRASQKVCPNCSKSDRKEFVVAQKLARYLIRWRSADDRFPFAPLWPEPVREMSVPAQPLPSCFSDRQKGRYM